MESLEEKKLDELIEIEKENNTMLRKMRRSMVWSQWMTVIYWLFIIGGLGWAYYAFQPYVREYISLYDTLTKTIRSIDAESRSLPSNLKNILSGANE